MSKKQTPLRRYIRATGLHFGAVAVHAGITRQNMSALCRNRETLELATAQKIVRALQEMTGRPVSIEELWPTPAEKVSA